MDNLATRINGINRHSCCGFAWTRYARSCALRDNGHVWTTACATARATACWVISTQPRRILALVAARALCRVTRRVIAPAYRLWDTHALHRTSARTHCAHTSTERNSCRCLRTSCRTSAPTLPSAAASCCAAYRSYAMPRCSMQRLWRTRTAATLPVRAAALGCCTARAPACTTAALARSTATTTLRCMLRCAAAACTHTRIRYQQQAIVSSNLTPPHPPPTRAAPLPHTTHTPPHTLHTLTLSQVQTVLTSLLLLVVPLVIPVPLIVGAWCE